MKSVEEGKCNRVVDGPCDVVDGPCDVIVVVVVEVVGIC